MISKPSVSEATAQEIVFENFCLLRLCLSLLDPHCLAQTQLVSKKWRQIGENCWKDLRWLRPYMHLTLAPKTNVSLKQLCCKAWSQTYQGKKGIISCCTKKTLRNKFMMFGGCWDDVAVNEINLFAISCEIDLNSFGSDNGEPMHFDDFDVGQAESIFHIANFSQIGNDSASEGDEDGPSNPHQYGYDATGAEVDDVTTRDGELREHKQGELGTSAVCEFQLPAPEGIPRLTRVRTSENSVPSLAGMSSIQAPDGNILFAGGWSDEYETSFCDMYKIQPESMIITKFGELPYRSSFQSLAVVGDGNLCLFGGGSSMYQMATVRDCSLMANILEEELNWVTGPPMSTPRCGHASVTLLNGSIIIIGGYGGGTTYHRSCEMYDPVALQYYNLGPRGNMSTPRTGFVASLGLDGAVYVAGGSCDGSSGLKEVERYDPREGNWQRLPDLNCRRSYLAGDFAGFSNLVVHGGYHIPQTASSVNHQMPLSGPRSWECIDIRAGYWRFLDISTSNNVSGATVERALHTMKYFFV
jgi:hypothetical protein